MVEILLGAGADRRKKMAVLGNDQWRDLVTVDFNADHKPDVVHDLSVLPLPFEDNSAGEIHAYDVMEHIGQQGDWRFFFDQWSDFWRILKPNGFFVGISPHWSSPWAWGDPGHTRIIGAEQLGYLRQPNYPQPPRTDYRFYYKADFDLIHSQVNSDGQYEYVLRAVKPSRIDYGDH